MQTDSSVKLEPAEYGAPFLADRHHPLTTQPFGRGFPTMPGASHFLPPPDLQHFLRMQSSFEAARAEETMTGRRDTVSEAESEGEPDGETAATGKPKGKCRFPRLNP